MDAAAEGDVHIGVALDVEVVGAVEDFGVAVGAGDEPAHAVVFVDGLAIELDVVHRDALDGADGGVVAEAFFGGADGLAFRVGLEDGPLVGMLGEGQGTVADEVDGGFVAGGQQEHYVVDGHIPVEDAFDFAFGDHGDEVVVGFAFLDGVHAFRDQGGDVVLEVLHGAGQGDHTVGAFAVEEAEVFGELAEDGAVAVGDAQHPGDDEQGEGGGQVGHYVHPAFFLYFVEQFVNGGLHQGAPHFHGFGGEVAVHNPAHIDVVGAGDFGVEAALVVLDEAGDLPLLDEVVDFHIVFVDGRVGRSDVPGVNAG